VPPTNPITLDASHIDLAPRFLNTSAIVGSPATNAETIVAQIPAIRGDVAVQTGVWLSGVVSFTVGTSGTAINVRIRQTNVSGSVVAATGAITGGVSAGNLLSQDLQGFDSGAGVAVYVLTLQVTGGAATSTVSAVNLIAIPQ
jgi:hypothetical protein